MRQSYAESVAATVRAEVARRRVTQGALAEVLGMSQAAVSRRLSGAVAFDVEELSVVAAHLGGPVERLIPQDAA